MTVLHYGITLLVCTQLHNISVIILVGIWYHFLKGFLESIQNYPIW